MKIFSFVLLALVLGASLSYATGKESKSKRKPSAEDFRDSTKKEGRGDFFKCDFMLSDSSIFKIYRMVGTLDSNGSAQLNRSATFDLSNARFPFKVDVRIKKTGVKDFLENEIYDLDMSLQIANGPQMAVSTKDNHSYIEKFFVLDESTKTLRLFDTKSEIGLSVFCSLTVKMATLDGTIR